MEVTTPTNERGNVVSQNANPSRPYHFVLAYESVD